MDSMLEENIKKGEKQTAELDEVVVALSKRLSAAVVQPVLERYVSRTDGIWTIRVPI